VKILLVSSEIAPFAKTGGLADVSGALPLELARRGHDVRVVMPRYKTVDEATFNLLPILSDIRVRLGSYTYIAQVLRTNIPGSKVPAYFIDNSHFYDRPGLYEENGQGYPDNAVRFAFFCKAVIWLLKGLDWIPDVIHCNDWQTALIPVYLRTDPEMMHDGELSRMPVLYTIHNLAYQGLFPRSEAVDIGIGDNLLHPAALEYYGQMNLMKGGIVFSQRVSTVSPRYAREIQTTEFGCGLEGVLRMRANNLSGILNGIDYEAWNPATDPALAGHFSSGDVSGKAKCKAALQRQQGLPELPDTPLLAIISRLDPQKGLDLVLESIDDILKMNAQLVVLGTGNAAIQQAFEKKARENPKQISVNLKFDNNLAHQIEAGADVFLMPSRFEPCGLNQMYSLRYGTVPVVRETGGLADSVVEYHPPAAAPIMEAASGTGFLFPHISAAEFTATVRKSVALYRDKAEWEGLQRRGMETDFSWTAAADAYKVLYDRVTG